MVTIEEVRAILSPDEPDYSQARALGADALPMLRQLIHSADPMLASKAIYAAGVIGGDAGVGILEEAVDSSVALVRVAAAAAVGELPPQLGTQVLIRLLGDSDSGVRRRAVRSAASRTDPALRPRIEAISTSDADPRLRSEAAAILRRLPS